MARAVTMKVEIRRKVRTGMRVRTGTRVRMGTRMRQTKTRITRMMRMGMRTRMLFMNLKYQVFLIGTCLAKTMSMKLQL